jgi:ABC-type antimicrobial peptide transport system permease subunit
MTSARTREIGIRIALGASVGDIVYLILRQAALLTAGAVAIGVLLAPAAIRVIGALLFGVGPYDPITLLAVSALLALISMTASAVPALRAARSTSAAFR